MSSIQCWKYLEVVFLLAVEVVAQGTLILEHPDNNVAELKDLRS